MARVGTRTCKLVLIDEVWCTFHNIHPDHIDLLVDTYALFAANYFFNPEYTLGTWDGKIKFFHTNGRTYINLLPEILPVLTALEYEVDIVDRRTSNVVVDYRPIDEDFFFDVPDKYTDGHWKVRDYQIGLVNALVKAGGGIGIAGTGAGKTSMCAAIAKYYERYAGFRSIIIVPDKNLTVQTTEEYQYFNLDAGSFYGDEKQHDRHHVVSTWQSLQNNPTLITQFQVVIVDECHGLRGKVISRLLNEYGKNVQFRFGVTGTMPKDPTERMQVNMAVGEVLYEIPAHELIAEGHLSSVNIQRYNLHIGLRNEYERFKQDMLDNEVTLDEIPSYRSFYAKYFPDWASEKKYLQNEKRRRAWIVQFIQELSEMGNTFVLVNGVSVGRQIANEIEGAVFLSGKDDVAERKAQYDRYKTENGLTTVATVNIASTGLDIPRIFFLVYIDMGKSFIRTIQTIGRGLRKASDKDSVKVFDIYSDFKYGKSHSNLRVKYYDEAQYPHEYVEVNLGEK